MTDETKQLLDAPWFVTLEEIRKDTVRYCVAASHLDLVAIDLTHENAHRLARLPELYDALMWAIVQYCPDAFLFLDECRLCGEKKCKGREAVELLRKVRDGE